MAKRTRKPILDASDVVTLRAGDVDIYRKAAARAEFFRENPETVLIARKWPDGRMSAFQVKCVEPSCYRGIARHRIRAIRDARCEEHKHPMFDGVALRLPHLVALRDKLVYVSKYARGSKAGKPSGKYMHIFKIRCGTPGCSGLVDVTSAASAATRKFCQRCTYTKDNRMYVKRNASQVTLSDKQKKKVRRSIVAYIIKRSKKGTWLKKPALRCCIAGCWEIMAFSVSRYLENGEKLYCTTHGRYRRRLRPYEALYNLTKKGALARNLPFHLTLRQFSLLVKKGSCRYCGISVSARPYLSEVGEKRHYRSHLDRIDNTKGYTLKNISIACSACNLTRFRWLLAEEMEIIGQLRAGNVAQAQEKCVKYAEVSREHGKILQRIGFHIKREYKS